MPEYEATWRHLSLSIDPERDAITHHLQNIYREEEHQCNYHTHEFITRSITFEFANEQLHALDYIPGQLPVES